MGAEAHLVGGEALFGAADCLFDDGLGAVVPVVAHTRGSVEAEAAQGGLPRSAEQVGGRFSRDLAAQVPQGAVEAGVGDVVGPHRFVVRGQVPVPGVAADEGGLELLDAGGYFGRHPVGARLGDPLQALVRSR